MSTNKLIHKKHFLFSLFGIRLPKFTSKSAFHLLIYVFSNIIEVSYVLLYVWLRQFAHTLISLK